MALSGWIKLHRALSDHHIASNPDSLSVWVHLLMLANHADAKRLINGQLITVAAGQILTSRKSLSEKTGVQESKVERILKRLESEQQIEQRGMSKFRVISIVKWAEYQGQDQQTEQQMNSKRTTDEQQVNTLEEVLPSGNTQECEEGKEKSLKPMREKTTRKVSGFDPISSRPDCVSEKAWADWCQHRKEIKKALTAKSVEQQAIVLAASSYPDALIYKSIANGWAGIFPDSNQKTAQATSKHTGFEQRDYFEGLTQREDGTYGL